MQQTINVGPNVRHSRGGAGGRTGDVVLAKVVRCQPDGVQSGYGYLRPARFDCTMCAVFYPCQFTAQSIPPDYGPARYQCQDDQPRRIAL